VGCDTLYKFEMKRWFLVGLSVLVGLTMLLGGLLVPAHLRAVDAKVIERAGKKSRSLVEEGLVLLTQKQLGSAEQLLQVAKTENLKGHPSLETAVQQFARTYPALLPWGGADFSLEKLFPTAAIRQQAESTNFIEFVVQGPNREKLLEFLNASTVPEVRIILQGRAWTNTVLFPSAQTASGQAWESALAVGGLLLHEHRLKPGLHVALARMATEAQRGGSTQPFEQALMDLMSLAQRFNWVQLVAFVGQIDDEETLRRLAHLVQKADARLPVLFSAVQLSGNPAAVERYLMEFSQTGWKDLAGGLHFGAGGLKELLQRKLPLYSPRLRNELVGYDPFATLFSVVLDACWLTPWVALSLKWFCYLTGGFLLGMAFHYGKPAVSALERPLQVRGFHLAREFLFALGFLLVVLLLSEPFLAQESQKADFFPFRLQLPMAGKAVAAGIARASSSSMNQLSLLSLLLFFVLQALIYTACLIKLAEIRRQGIPSRTKLKLLENEDHLFDAGLYLGFVGTIISLILVSLGVIKPSLMAAYSSTSFGIIFVSIFKIFHLRPLRRRLLMETEALPS